MARQNINIGTNANDGTGDDLRTAMQKINTNFTELYAETAVDQGITISGNNISSNRSNDDIVLVPNGTGDVRMPAITIHDNHVQANRSNDDLMLDASGTGSVVIAKADINGGAIDGTIIGANSAAAVTTSSLVATTADINAGTIDNTTIGASTQSTGNFTSLLASNILVDGNIDIRDNVIKTVQTNSNLELTTTGTGGIIVSEAGGKIGFFGTTPVTKQSAIAFDPSANDGSTVEVKPTYGASILVDNRPQAYEWLRENGYDDIIKNNVICSFGRGEDDKASAFKAFAAKEGYVANQKTEIHSQTLRAFVKERVEAGDAFPMELFGAWVGQRAVIKRGK